MGSQLLSCGFHALAAPARIADMNIFQGADRGSITPGSSVGGSLLLTHLLWLRQVAAAFRAALSPRRGGPPDCERLLPKVADLLARVLVSCYSTEMLARS